MSALDLRSYSWFPADKLLTLTLLLLLLLMMMMMWMQEYLVGWGASLESTTWFCTPVTTSTWRAKQLVNRSHQFTGWKMDNLSPNVLQTNRSDAVLHFTCFVFPLTFLPFMDWSFGVVGQLGLVLLIFLQLSAD